jgi:hypothetical protein
MNSGVVAVKYHAMNSGEGVVRYHTTVWISGEAAVEYHRGPRTNPAG